MNKKSFTKGLLTGALIGALGLVMLKKKKRIKAKIWMWKVKNTIMSELRKLKKPNQGDFESIVDRALEKYKNFSAFSEEKAESLGENLKGKWKSIKKSLDEEDEDDEEEEDEEEE